jgi:ATP-binding cassette subfamily G (WHITE) protein 2
MSGYYRISTFFIAKLICDVLPMRVIPSIIFSLIAYFMTGLQRSAGQFFVFLSTIFMASVCGSAICFFISATIPVFGKFIDSVHRLVVASSICFSFSWKSLLLCLVFADNQVLLFDFVFIC